MIGIPVPTRAATIAMLAVAFSTPAIAQPDALSPTALFERLSPSVFMVVTYAGTEPKARQIGTGSAVVIAPETVITNCHVLRKSQRVEVVNGPVRLAATLEFPDVERDLCQMRVPGLKAPPVTLGTSAGIRVGQRVYAIGAPRGFELTLSDGLVSSLRTMVTKDRIEPWIQTSAPISPGSSGGGLFDEQGRLIGITTLSSLTGNLAFAVPAEQVREVPERGRLALAADAARRAEAAAKLKESEATGTGQRLVGEALAQHFPATRRAFVFTRASNEMRSFSTRGNELVAVEADGVAVNGSTKVDRANDLVCFTVNPIGIRTRAVSMYDCFEVWEVGNGEFEMRLKGRSAGMAYRIQ